MQPMTLRAGWLYPALLTGVGDRSALVTLQRRCEWRGLRVEVTELHAGQRPRFDAFDLLLLLDGEPAALRLVADDLTVRGEWLRDAMEEDVAMLGVGAGFWLLGHSYQPETGDALAGAGALDLRSEAGPRRPLRYAAVECEFARKTFGGPRTLVGFERGGARTRLGPAAEPLGRTLAGEGNNGEDGGEGARARQVYATALGGALLPLNPWFADYLIMQGLRHRYDGVAPLGPLHDGAEERAHEVALKQALRSKGKPLGVEATAWTE